MSTLRLGHWGEAVAADHLQRHGWTILERNFRLGHKEIDLVARRGNLVAFVEVKTRRSRLFGHALEAIDTRKQRDVGEAAQAWIEQFGSEQDSYRFDAFAIFRDQDGSTQLEYLEDAWRL